VTTADLRFDSHVSNVARACNYHTGALRHVRSLLTDETAQTVACSIVASRLDYCNALLYGALAETLNKLQRAQNNLAIVVCQRDGRADDRLTPSLGVNPFEYLDELSISKTRVLGLSVIIRGQSKGERGGTAFPHLLFSVCIVPPPEF